jgi:hypothetical protein
VIRKIYKCSKIINGMKTTILVDKELANRLMSLKYQFSFKTMGDVISYLLSEKPIHNPSNALGEVSKCDISEKEMTQQGGNNKT